MRRIPRWLGLLGVLGLLVACADGGTPGGMTSAATMAMPAPTGMAAPMMGKSMLGAIAPAPPPSLAYPGEERYEKVAPSGFKSVATDPVSTFAASVDTASYANLRRYLLESHRLPPADAVRVEELLNYFPYAYAKPASAEERFRPTVWVYPSPWHKAAKILQIGIKGWAPPLAERPKLNLVLLIDVSGSMSGPDRLPLLKQGFAELADTLRPDDRLSIVTYANGTKLVLEPTGDKQAIKDALAGLGAGGGTYGAGGLQLAYEQAERQLDPQAVNRIILGTDGDFNIGITDRDALIDFIKAKRSLGVYLSFLGVGRGNYNDALANRLVYAGKGNASYVDSLDEMRRVLIERQSSTLGALADDVKFQVEFNPARVAQYRLIGFETRALKAEDFKDDLVPAGDIGPGHEVTALYEVLSPKAASKRLEKSRYAHAKPAVKAKGVANLREEAFLRIRFKPPGAADSVLVTRPITDADGFASLDKAPADARFAVAVAGFGQLLRHDPAVGTWRYEDVLALAAPSIDRDSGGLRHQFLELVTAAAKARDLRN